MHNERIQKLIGKEIVLVTYQKYLDSQRLKTSFINEYTYYLTTVKNFQQSTLNKAIQRMRKVVKFAIGYDYLDKDPFLLCKAR